jgi:predicted TIM-barrel fold metal-dependent hydrolase
VNVAAQPRRLVGEGAAMERDFPLIVSVDDHVIEPPHVWQDRLPERFCADGPRVVRSGVSQMGSVGGVYSWDEDPSGTPCDFWLFEDLRYPMTRVMAAAGLPREEVTVSPVTFEEMRPGSYDPVARLADLDEAGIEASLNFPTFPRFAGQAFSECRDKDLGFACIQAYNDWMVEEWCAEPRLVPICLVPFWDPALAAGEVRRNAARGVRAITFSEIPAYLGWPSIHDKDRYWDPLFAACAETQTVVCMHIGSGSKMPSTSADAPSAVQSTATFTNCMLSLCDWLFSGVLERYPALKIAYSEGQIGWIPYILERADHIWETNRAWGGVADLVRQPPSHTFARQVYGCFFSDRFGLKNIDEIGRDNVMFECDYPHADSTWPDTQKVAKQMCEGLDPDVIEKVMRSNAIGLFGLEERLGAGRAG